MSPVTGHCPHCGEPVRLVPVTRLVAGALSGCACDVHPDLVGPDDGVERHPSRFAEPLQRAAESNALDDPPDSDGRRSEGSARTVREPPAASTDIR